MVSAPTTLQTTVVCEFWQRPGKLEAEWPEEPPFKPEPHLARRPTVPASRAPVRTHNLAPTPAPTMGYPPPAGISTAPSVSNAQGKRKEMKTVIGQPMRTWHTLFAPSTIIMKSISLACLRMLVMYQDRLSLRIALMNRTG